MAQNPSSKAVAISPANPLSAISACVSALSNPSDALWHCWHSLGLGVSGVEHLEQHC